MTFTYPEFPVNTNRSSAFVEREKLFRKAIEGWVEGRRTDVLSRFDLASMEGMERVVALRNGLLANVIAHCRKNPRSDAALAILAIVIALSDNNDGYCYISAGRIAEVLSRTRQRVQTTLSKLVTDGFLFSESIPGSPTRYSPAIHEAFSEKAAAVWFVTALSDAPHLRDNPAIERFASVIEGGVTCTRHPCENNTNRCHVEGGGGVTSKGIRVSRVRDTISLSDITKDISNSPKNSEPNFSENSAAAEKPVFPEPKPEPKSSTKRQGELPMKGKSPAPEISTDDVNRSFGLLDEAMAGVWTRAASKTTSRRSAMRALISQEGPAYILEIAMALRTAEYARGKNDNGWIISIDNLLFDEDKRARLLEGRYGKNKIEIVESDADKIWRFRMANWTKFMAKPEKDRWNPATGVYLPWRKDWGPQPDEPGCQVSEKILTEFAIARTAIIVDLERERQLQPAARIAAWIKADGKTWPSHWGPRPGQQGCTIPQDVLDANQEVLASMMESDKKR